MSKWKKKYKKVIEECDNFRREYACSVYKYSERDTYNDPLCQIPLIALEIVYKNRKYRLVDEEISNFKSLADDAPNVFITKRMQDLFNRNLL